MLIPNFYFSCFGVLSVVFCRLGMAHIFVPRVPLYVLSNLSSIRGKLHVAETRFVGLNWYYKEIYESQLRKRGLPPE